jgi:hypothetical protein
MGKYVDGCVDESLDGNWIYRTDRQTGGWLVVWVLAGRKSARNEMLLT